MTLTARAWIGVATVLLSAAPVTAQRFQDVTYLDGLKRHETRQAGALVVANGELRFEDKKGQVVFVLPLGAAKAWIGAEKRTTVGSIFRSTALMMVAVPLSVGAIDPMQAWSRDTRPVLVVQLGASSGGSLLRWRGRELGVIAEAINRAANDAALVGELTSTAPKPSRAGQLK